jgi:regulator of protease activity HflC (stomatin/prohibitin superfamily)
MAADLWREYLGKFRLSELFEIGAGRTETTVQFINDMIKKRLSKQYVEVVDAFGKVKIDPRKEKEHAILLKNKQMDAAAKLQEMMESTEYKTLTGMGLEVTSVTIKRLIFSPDIEERLVNQWTTMWQKNAMKERDQVERERKLAEAGGQEDALREFALEASREISQGRARNRANALEKLVHATFRAVQRNSDLLKRINTEQRELMEIVSWLKDLGGPSA